MIKRTKPVPPPTTKTTETRRPARAVDQESLTKVTGGITAGDDWEARV